MPGGFYVLDVAADERSLFGIAWNPGEASFLDAVDCCCGNKVESLGRSKSNTVHQAIDRRRVAEKIGNVNGCLLEESKCQKGECLTPVEGC